MVLSFISPNNYVSLFNNFFIYKYIVSIYTYWTCKSYFCISYFSHYIICSKSKFYNRTYGIRYFDFINFSISSYNDYNCFSICLIY